MNTVAWTIEDEIEYLNNIGTFSKNCEKKTRLELLEGYMRGFSHRQNWETIDRKKIQIHLARTIRKERK